jgi:hypothetical protein
MKQPNKYKQWLIILLFGIGYAVVGIAFPNPSNAGETQRMWRLAAWAASVIIFGIQMWYEHFRFHNRQLKTALHIAISATIGAFALAVAANIHALHSNVSHHSLLVASLILWPIFIAVPAFLFAIIIAFVLTKIKPMNKP